VRAAYQRKGWVMLKLSDVTQCAHDGYLEGVAAQEGEGCRMWGQLHVNKVAGNFHFAAGKSYQQARRRGLFGGWGLEGALAAQERRVLGAGNACMCAARPSSSLQPAGCPRRPLFLAPSSPLNAPPQGSVHIHDVSPFAGKTLDFTHTISHLSFGPQYPGMINPLDGATSASVVGASAGGGGHGRGGRGGRGGHGKRGGGDAGSGPQTGMFQYFVKVRGGQGRWGRAGCGGSAGSGGVG
jgi:hypothetical protein